MTALETSHDHVGVTTFGEGDGMRCLIVPGFGTTAAEMAPVAHALLQRGFAPKAIDPRNHVGAGSGTIADYRLSSVVEDVHAALENYSPHLVVAFSLGARATLRALVEWGTPVLAVLVTPVVDLRRTLHSVIGVDWMAVPRPAVPRMVEVQDAPVRAPEFLNDAEDQDLVTVASTSQDLRNAPGSVRLIAGDADPWIDAAQVLTAAARSANSRVTCKIVKADTHDLRNDEAVGRRYVAAVLAATQRPA